MEALRVPPYEDVSVTFTVPSGYTDEQFTVTVTDMADLSTTTLEFEKDSEEVIEFFLNGRYDNDYHVEITDEESTTLFSDTYELRRPYIDPSSKGTTASEIAEYKKNEELARAIIDSIIEDGFYYKKKVIEFTGLGTDYHPLWFDAKKVVAVYENNVLVTDRSYQVSPDKTAIMESYTGAFNRNESAPIELPASSSDSLDVKWSTRGFPKTYDYKVVLEVGHLSVPSDIVRAAELLIEDISCGKLDYYKRYISSYNTDQFKIQFDKGVFEGTGNILVDKILSKYQKSIRRLGVL
jgi:hypothetical protein